MLLLLALLVTGCAAQKQIGRARAAFVADNPAAAARHYQAALDLKPSLADDRDFMAEVTLARRDAAVDAGQSLIQQQQWLMAIDQFQAALAMQPDHAPAEQGLARARDGAADMFHARAIEHADADQLDDARQALQEALTHRSDHARARQALRLLDEPAAASPQAVQSYRQGVEQIEQQRWRQAADALTDAVEREPDHLPARAALHQAQQTLAQAQHLYEQGQAQHEARQVDTALATLKDAHALAPHEADIAALLDETRQRRAEVDRRVEVGFAALNDDRWDDAIAAADEARELFPDAPMAQRLDDEARDAAAAHHATVGRAQLDDGDLDAAESTLRKALTYRPSHLDARRSLSQVMTKRGDTAADQQRWGAALLNYLDAHEAHATADGTERIETARAWITRRAAVGIELRQGDEPVTGDEAVFESRLQRHLAATAPEGVELRRGPVLDEADIRYGYFVAVVDVSVEQALESSKPRVHRYRDQRLVLNPELDRIERRLERAERDVDRAHRELERQRDQYRRAERRARNDPASEVRQRSFRQEQRDIRDAREDLQNELRDQRRAERKLRRTPGRVPATVTLEWPYEVETYRKTGRLIARMHLHDPLEDRPMPPLSVESSFNDTDTAIRHAEPAIGLGADPLTLPADAEVADAMIDDAVRKAADRLIDAVVDAHTTRLRAEASRMEAQGDDAAALEARVDAAALLEAVDRQAGRAALRRLRPQ